VLPPALQMRVCPGRPGASGLKCWNLTFTAVSPLLSMPRATRPAPLRNGGGDGAAIPFGQPLGVDANYLFQFCALNTIFLITGRFPTCSSWNCSSGVKPARAYRALGCHTGVAGRAVLLHLCRYCFSFFLEACTIHHCKFLRTG